MRFNCVGGVKRKTWAVGDILLKIEKFNVNTLGLCWSSSLRWPHSSNGGGLGQKGIMGMGRAVNVVSNWQLQEALADRVQCNDCQVWEGQIRHRRPTNDGIPALYRWRVHAQTGEVGRWIYQVVKAAWEMFYFNDQGIEKKRKKVMLKQCKAPVRLPLEYYKHFHIIRWC